jgi:cytochrome c biogenesis protein CcdA/thiol-disulfide isomerase/thioredoxin
MLIGLALTFALVASLAAVAGGWAVQANAIGRWIALVVLAAFGLALLLPSVADRSSRPLMALGGWLSQTAQNGRGAVLPSLLLGVATGLLWAPCAGPILGLVLTGAALQGASARTTLLLLAYALGAATSLALALLAGGRVYAVLERTLPAGAWVRRGLGVLVLAAVVAIFFGLDTGFLTRVSSASTASLEQGLLDRLHPAPKPVADTGKTLPVLGPMPPLTGATAWLNSPPLTPDQLKGKVVLVDFWTYSCINCLRALPHVEQWARRYGPQGLVVIGVHTPEFAFEKQSSNVQRAIRDFGVAYPVAMDNDYAIWKAFNNDGWPAGYLVDAQGRLRFIHAGEGQYDQPEAAIRALLAERNGAPVTGAMTTATGVGVQAPPDGDDAFSPETYLGYGRAHRFASPGGAPHDQQHNYSAPAKFEPDGWALAGRWQVAQEFATELAPGARVLFRFHSRDLHMVLGPGPDGKPVRFRIMLDGKPPGDDHGLDVDAAGNGVITGQRLYQLVRQQKVGQADRVFQIEYLDPGAQAFTFTFG